MYKTFGKDVEFMHGVSNEELDSYLNIGILFFTFSFNSVVIKVEHIGKNCMG